MYTQRMEQSAASRRTWDWLAVILVILLIQVSAARLAMTAWAPFLYFTQTLAFYSTLLGIFLGYSSFHKQTVGWLAFLYSLAIVPWQLTRAIDIEGDFTEHLASLGGRMLTSLGEFIMRKPVDDSLFFVALVSLGYWIIGLTSGYFLTRHKNYLAVVLPAGLAALIVQLYDYLPPTRIWELAIYIFLALALLGRFYVNQSRTRWEQERVFVTYEATQDLRNSLLVVAAVVVFVAWSVPTSVSSLKSASQAWSRFSRPMRERLSNIVTSLKSTYGSGTPGDYYGEKLPLGSNAELGDALVFSVRINAPLESQPPRYYWRGRVYDYYSKGQWINSSGNSRTFAPAADQFVPLAREIKQREILFTFTNLAPREKLFYAPAEPIWINRPGTIWEAPASDSTWDLQAWLANQVLYTGDRYQVRAMIADPTISDLKNAGEAYPDWVTARYLQVPDEVAARLKPLAEELTQNQPTPYDKAQAITSFLRGWIRYSTSIDTPPAGEDPVLWVLTDYKKGFCTYYASAEILLLRTLGIPARMAVGFAQGTVEENNASGNISYGYDVHQVDAHAWPEVYFPGIGWVEFEPTVSQAPLIRPTEQAAAAPAPGASTAVPPIQTPLAQEDSTIDQLLETNTPVKPTPFLQTAQGHAALIFSLLFVLAVLFFGNRRFGWSRRLPVYIADAYTRSGSPPPNWVDRWARWSHLTSIERSFQAVNLGLTWLGKPQPIFATPQQRAEVLRGLLPSASEAIDSLLAEHEAALYSPRPGHPKRARRAALDLLLSILQSRLRARFAGSHSS